MNHKQRHSALWLLAGLLPVTAPAQTTFTVSGMLDQGIYRGSDKNWQMGTIQRSHIQFSGTEKLDDDLYAIFTISPRFELDTGKTEDNGTKPLWHNETSVGLKGSFGTLQFGRKLDAMYANDWYFDPWSYFDRISSPGWDLWHYNYPSDPHGNLGKAEWGRLNNGIYYDTPNFSGFSAHFSGSPESEPGDTDKPLTTALQYRSTGFAAMVAHGKNSLGATDSLLGLRVNRGNLSVMSMYDVSKNTTSTARAATLGMKYTDGRFTYRAGAGQVIVDRVKAERMLGLSGSYALSARTSIYLDYARKVYVASAAHLYGIGMVHTF